jgi:hypothetical protein
LDLWIKFGKMIVKVWDNFLSGAEFNDTNLLSSQEDDFSIFRPLAKKFWGERFVPFRKSGTVLCVSQKSAGFWRFWL